MFTVYVLTFLSSKVRRRALQLPAIMPLPYSMAGESSSRRSYIFSLSTPCTYKPTLLPLSRRMSNYVLTYTPTIGHSVPD